MHVYIRIKRPAFSCYSNFLKVSVFCVFYITHIIPHSPDDRSLEPKRYSVDFASQ